MSIDVMSCVWKRFPASGSELLAMLAFADWCSDDGGSLYPSMKAIANKIRVSEKQARRIVRGFELGGFLAVVGNAHGGAPGTTKQFRLNVKKLADLPLLDASSPPASVTPPMGVQDPSHPAPKTPPTHGSQSTIETPISVKEKKKRVTAPTFAVPDWINKTHWDAWHSCAKRKNASDAQKQMAVDKLDSWRQQGIDHAAALENAAIAGWQGLFKPDVPASAMTPARRNSPTGTQNTHKHAAAAATIYEGVWDAE